MKFHSPSSDWGGGRHFTWVPVFLQLLKSFKWERKEAANWICPLQDFHILLLLILLHSRTSRAHSLKCALYDPGGLLIRLVQITHPPRTAGATSTHIHMNWHSQSNPSSWIKARRRKMFKNVLNLASKHTLRHTHSRVVRHLHPHRNRSAVGDLADLWAQRRWRLLGLSFSCSHSAQKAWAGKNCRLETRSSYCTYLLFLS